MSTTIKLRRSAVPGRVPTTSQLELGEIAINTADGKLYFKKYDPVSNTESIIDVSADLDASAILSLLSGVDGANSGLDADLLDGQDGSYYLDYNNFTNVPPATFDLTLIGKVTGTAFSNTGVMILTTELANTGVTAGTYGSASLVPVITVDEDGRITSANTVSVAGVANTYWTVANNTFTIETADGGVYNTLIDEFTGLTVNGDIIVSGLVDGRDIAADGLILDTLAAATTTVNLSGKVTGSAVSNNGIIDLVTELANTGVIAGTYGSSTAIPVLTVDEDGRITVANTASVAGVNDFYFVDANNTITLETGDGSIYLARINKLDRIEEDLTVTLEGKVTGTVTSNTGVMTVQTELANTGVTAGTYGSSTAIPVLTIDEDGRITIANTASVAGVNDFYWTSSNNTLILETGDGSSYLVPIDTFTNITVNDLTANNIIVSGLVDGRDIAVDGAKLDGIEAGATGDQTASEILALLLTVDGDGSGLDADFIDGYSASEILDAAANNAAAVVGAGNITITANNGLSGVVEFNVNTANNEFYFIEHADTSSVSDATNTNGNVLQSITFDTFGHVQNISSTDLDNRYYTETESDARFVNTAGDTMTGDLTVNANIIQSQSAFVSTTSTTTTTSQTAIYAFPHSVYSAAEIIITANEATNRHVTKLLITHDGSTAIATEYGTVYTGSELASYDIAINGPVLQILSTPASSSSTTFKIAGTLIKV